MAEEDKKEREEGEEQELEEGEEAGEGKPKKKGINKTLIIIVVAVLAAFGGGIGVAKFLLADKKAPVSEEEAAHGAEGEEAGEHEVDSATKQAEEAAHAAAVASHNFDEETFFVNMPSVTVNLRGPVKSQRYLKLSVRLEVKDEKEGEIIKQYMPRIRDQFQVFLRELRVEDLEGAAGAYRLREELLVRANAVAKPAVIKQVLFDEMLIQ